MEKVEFKKALLRGQGRCIPALLAEPERYRATVLWACNHEVAFDAQCEGSRADFVWRMISAYEDKYAFLEAAVSAFKETKPRAYWKFVYLSELLNCFAAEGYAAAEEALWTIYGELYSLLLSRKRLPAGPFPERDCYAGLCGLLAKNRASFERIAGDFGRLCSENSKYDVRDLCPDMDAAIKHYLPALKIRKRKPEEIEAFLRAVQAGEDWLTGETQAAGAEMPPQGRFALSRWLRTKADPETRRRYARAYLEQRDADARAEALELFVNCPFPCDPAPVIKDAKSANERLRTAAWRALENTRHPLVRDFAVENLNKGVDAALYMFIKNYMPQDAARLTELVKAIPVTRSCRTPWHQAFSAVLDMASDGLKAPTLLLEHIYEESFCSCCREQALRQLGRRRHLPDSVLRECLYDSNYKIRRYAENCLKRRS